MRLTVGSIVHFFDHSRPRDASAKVGPHAAIVTATVDNRANLTVFPDGYPPFTIASVGEGGPEVADAPTYWMWPARD